MCNACRGEKRGEGEEGRKWRCGGEGEKTVAIINGDRREPGNIWLSTSGCSGGNNQIAEQNHLVVDFRRLVLAVTIKLQNKTMCTRDILPTQ